MLFFKELWCHSRNTLGVTHNSIEHTCISKGVRT